MTGACWLAVCCAGGYVAMHYQFEPGRLPAGCGRWPAGTSLESSPNGITVVAFLHPRCVCTAATVKHLVGALHQQPDAQLIAVMFAPPEPDSAKEWRDGEYLQSIRAGVPGARIVFDSGGREAGRFGAATSGTVLAYDRAGNEVFRGGITDRRGGDNGSPALRSFVRMLAEDEACTPHGPVPVYGCPLDDGTRPRPTPSQNK